MEMGNVMWRGWWGHGQDTRGDMEMFKVFMVVGHEEGTGRWWWTHGDGKDHLEMVKETQEGRERGQGRSWR